MNTNLENQYFSARSMIQEAAIHGDVTLGKFGSGVMLGILVASLPEEDSQALFQAGMYLGNCNSIDEVLDFAAMLDRRSSDIF